MCDCDMLDAVAALIPQHLGVDDMSQGYGGVVIMSAEMTSAGVARCTCWCASGRGTACLNSIDGDSPM